MTKGKIIYQITEEDFRKERNEYKFNKISGIIIFIFVIFFPIYFYIESLRIEAYK